MLRKLDLTNLTFLATAHAMALFAIVYMAVFHFSWWTVGLACVWLTLTGVSITGGYHRLFAHPTYQASRVVRGFYLLFGSAAVQNSALKWAADHRTHHQNTDQDADPYNIKKGFWWAHIGWVLHKEMAPRDLAAVRDLQADPLVRLQHRYYAPIALVMGGLVPAALGLLWGDVLGALLVAGFLRLVVLWHATFSINSVAHLIGKQPYSLKTSARDSFWTALISLGEGYHNFHHRFQSDYRNGVRWYHFDPTKWWIWSLSKVGLTRSLKRVPARSILRARQSVSAELGRGA